MPQCKEAGCTEELTQERVLALFLAGVPEEDYTCQKHSLIKTKPIGFMGESSAGDGNSRNVSRKNGYELTIIDPRNANYKENLRRAVRISRRSR